MDKSEQAAFDAVQAEKTELGIAPEPVEAEPAEITPAEEPEAPKPQEPADPQEPSDREPAPKDFKEYKKRLREELEADYDKKLSDLREELGKAKPSETATQNLEEDIDALAKELDFDPDKTRKIIEVARKGIETLSPEDKALLEAYKAERTTRDQESAEREQKEIFDTEWKETEKSLRTRFPNATPEQLDKARADMDEIAHSEKYHETDMDYILFKESEHFGKVLFSPRQATFESPRPLSIGQEEEFPEFNSNMSPAQFAAFEKARERAMDTMGTEKVRITTRDDRGNVIERYE